MLHNAAQCTFVVTDHHSFVLGSDCKALCCSIIYPLATGLQPWVAICGIGNGGFLKF
jgi:hypothetical protein